jgi:hypothetical protein
MKQVEKKELPEVSGGEFSPDGCIPDPFPPGTDGQGSRDRFNPLVDPSMPDV